MAGLSFRMSKVDRIEDRGIIYGVHVQLVIGELIIELADDCDAFDSDVDEAPTAQTMFMANLSSTDPIYDVPVPSYDLDILSEVHDHDYYQDVVCEHHEVHEMHDDVQPKYVVDSHTDYTSNSNMIPYDQYVKENAVPVVQSNVSFVPNNAYMMILNDMHEQPTQYVSVTTQNNVVDKSLTAKLTTYKEQDELYERRARFELTEREQKIDKQLRIVITDRNIKEETLKKELHSVKMQLASTINHNTSMGLRLSYHQLTEKVSILQEQNKLFRVENEKLKQHYKELYDSIKIMRAKHIDQTTALLTENENLKVQINAKLKCVTIDSVTLKVLAPDRYAIDVEPIPPRLKNNREVYLDYLKHLKESVETLREIVKEAKAERPLDRSLASACLYTKHSQELLEYIALWYLDLGCSKHMTGDFSRLKNFTKKFIKTVRFGNDHFGSIMGYGDYVIGDSVISRVYYVEGLGHNLFSVRNKLNKAVPACIPTTTDTFMQLVVVSANQLDSNNNLVSNCLNSPTDTSNAGRTDHPLVFRLMMLKTYDRGSLTTQEFHIKFIGTIRFGNDHFGAIMGFGDYVIGDSVISRDWDTICFLSDNFVFSNLEVAFRKHSCFVQDTDGVLKNFTKKFIKTVRFGNDHFGSIMGYGDYVIGDSVISRVYYVEGLGHNLFSVSFVYVLLISLKSSDVPDQFQEDPPEVPMADNRTMAQLLQAPTVRYEDAIVIPEITATNFELKHGFIELRCGWKFLDKMPSDCLKIIESKSKVRQSRSKAVVTKVNSSSSTPSISSDIAELKDMVRALLLDKKNQSSAPALSPTPAPIKAVEPDCVTCGGAGTLPGNTITNPKEDLKGITTRSDVAYQGPTIPTPSKIVKQGTELPKKLGDPGKFLIPCEFPGMDEYLALADLGASINLVPLFVWKELLLPELTSTCMTLELADRSVSKPIGIAKDVSVKVGMFHFPADFVVVDFEPDPRVSLILRRCFLKTGRARIDVHKGELTLRIRNEAITYNLDQTSRYSANYDQMAANKIDVTDEACEEYSQEILGFSDVTASGSPTPSDDPIVSTTSHTLTPFGDSDFLLFEEADAFLGLEDDPNSSEFNPFYYDPEGDILMLEAILNSDPSPSLPTHEQYVPSFKNELKACEAKTIKSSVDEPPEVELKDLPPHLEYAFLEGDNKLPVIIAKELGDEENAALIKVLKSHKRAIAWKLSDIQGINLEFCTHKIIMEEDYKPAVQHQRRVNPKIHDVIKKEVEKLLDAGLIYPISDSPRVSPVHCVPKKGGFTVVKNEENELIPTRLVTGWWGTSTIVSSMVSLGIFKFPSTLVIRKRQRLPTLMERSPIVACLSVYATHRARFKGEFFRKLPLSVRQNAAKVLLLQEFDFDVLDMKGAENLAANHLS
nr:reverse transcriptase domain-containing protein [Tanacetum cinerariifolium]